MDNSPINGIDEDGHAQQMAPVAILVPGNIMVGQGYDPSTFLNISTSSEIIEDDEDAIIALSKDPAIGSSDDPHNHGDQGDLDGSGSHTASQNLDDASHTAHCSCRYLETGGSKWDPFGYLKKQTLKITSRTTPRFSEQQQPWQWIPSQTVVNPRLDIYSQSMI